MAYEHILNETNDGVQTITLNRPKVFNALNRDLILEITQAVEEAAANKEVRVVLMTGDGDKAFCSGADLKDGLGAEPKPLGQKLKEEYNPMILAMRNLKKPILCKLNGVAAGAGMSLALACDMIIARDDTYMTELFVGIGLMPDAGSMFFLPRLVGMQKAFELFSTGRKVYMKEALEIGLVTQSVPADKLDETVNQMLQYFTNAPTQAIGWMKTTLNQSLNSSLEEVLNAEAIGQTACGFTNDFGEGVMSFLQKRKPKFKGN